MNAERTSRYQAKGQKPKRKTTGAAESRASAFQTLDWRSLAFQIQYCRLAASSPRGVSYQFAGCRWQFAGREAERTRAAPFGAALCLKEERKRGKKE